MPKQPRPILSKKIRLAIGLAALLGPVVLVFGIINYFRAQQFIDSGARAEGTIRAFRSESMPRDTARYTFEVTWLNERDKKKYRKTFSTAAARWPEGPPQKTVTVIYDPKNPARSDIGMKFNPDNEPIVLGVFFRKLSL